MSVELEIGNLLKDGSRKLHGEWDSIPASLNVAAFKTQGATLAAAVPVTAGAVADWPVAWATETVLASHQAYGPLGYGAEVNPGTSQRSWAVTEPAGYSAAKSALQKDQIVKAGARLAQVLEAVWP